MGPNGVFLPVMHFLFLTVVEDDVAGFPAVAKPGGSAGWRTGAHGPIDGLTIRRHATLLDAIIEGGGT
jgi:hypothetical protein